MRVIVSTIVLGMALLTGSAAVPNDSVREQGNESALPIIHVPCIGCW